MKAVGMTVWWGVFDGCGGDDESIGGGDEGAVVMKEKSEG